MKSEEIILQEMEKDRLKKEAEAGGSVEGQEKSNVKFMISGEAPVLMSKACELLIKDLSFRAWRHTERNRRRTLQRQDLHAAVGESEVYDFLIDIVPRVNAAPPAPTAAAAAAASSKPPTTMNPPVPASDLASLGIPVPGMPQMGLPAPVSMHQHPGSHPQMSGHVGAPPPPQPVQAQQAPAPPAPAPPAGSLDVTSGAQGILGFPNPPTAEQLTDPANAFPWMFTSGLANLDGNDGTVAVQGGQQQQHTQQQQQPQQQQQQQQQVAHQQQQHQQQRSAPAQHQHQPAPMPPPPQQPHHQLHPPQPMPPQQQQQQHQLQQQQPLHLPHSLISPQNLPPWTDGPALNPSPQPPGM